MPFFFHHIAYYRGAMGILLVYDVTDERSFGSKAEGTKSVTVYERGTNQLLQM